MTLELTNPPGPYHVTPDQHRPEDAPMGFRGVGHYDTGTTLQFENPTQTELL